MRNTTPKNPKAGLGATANAAYLPEGVQRWHVLCRNISVLPNPEKGGLGMCAWRTRCDWRAEKNAPGVCVCVWRSLDLEPSKDNKALAVPSHGDWVRSSV